MWAKYNHNVPFKCKREPERDQPFFPLQREGVIHQRRQEFSRADRDMSIDFLLSFRKSANTLISVAGSEDRWASSYSLA